MLGKLPGSYDDWLVCMISTQLRHYGQDFDEIVDMNDPDFAASGLKATSVIRIGRLAVIDGAVLPGAVGEIASGRLQQIKSRLAQWLAQS
jgi:mRNA interferase MazF